MKSDSVPDTLLHLIQAYYALTTTGVRYAPKMCRGCLTLLISYAWLLGAEQRSVGLKRGSSCTILLGLRPGLRWWYQNLRIGRLCLPWSIKGGWRGGFPVLVYLGHVVSSGGGTLWSWSGIFCVSKEGAFRGRGRVCSSISSVNQYAVLLEAQNVHRRLWSCAGQKLEITTLIDKAAMSSKLWIQNGLAMILWKDSIYVWSHGWVWVKKFDLFVGNAHFGEHEVDIGHPRLKIVDQEIIK